MGWVVLIIVALLGNLYLFSGYDVEGDLAVFMVGIGLIFDAFFIFCIFKTIWTKIQSSIQEEKERRIAEEKRIQQAKIDAENRRIAQLKASIAQIVDRYKPKEVIWTPLGQPAIFDPELVNQDVVLMVKQYKRSLSDLIGKYREINSRINSILECFGIEVLEHQLEYLQMNESKLSELKRESDQAYREIASRKIQLLNEDDYISNILYKAFSLLKASKKCLSEKMKISELVIEKKPSDLGLFLYRCDPVILSFNGFYYCLFSRVILVFDMDGRFSTAIDPTAINISVERKTASIYVSNNSSTLSHKFVDTDSKKVQEGQTTSHWLYSNKDGSPDMRRTHNPLIQSRTDIYEYGEVTICIAESSIAFTVSSQAAIERLPYAGIEYSQKYNHLHNPTSDLIELVKYVSGSGNDTAACELEQAYFHIPKSENYFCKEVTM